MKNADIPASERKIVSKKIANAWKLSLGPSLRDSDIDGRYYIGLVADKIAIHETIQSGLTRIIAYFPHTEDGKIAASRCCDSLNAPIDEVINTDDNLSFEN